jgi:hypothetical protein
METSDLSLKSSGSKLTASAAERTSPHDSTVSCRFSGGKCGRHCPGPACLPGWPLRVWNRRVTWQATSDDINRGDVLDAAAAAPPQLCGTGMAQVSVRGVGGRGSERLRAEASRLRRPTRGRVVLRAASSFLPAFSQSSAPIHFGLSLQVCQASRRGGDVRQSGLGPGIEPSE